MRPTRCIALAAAALLAGCGDGGDDTAATSSTTAVTSEPSPDPTPAPACSASSSDADLTEQAGLPAAVARTRQQIADAAAACDYDALRSLVPEDHQRFTHSFGDSGDPVAFWRRQEQQDRPGRAPLRTLVAVLERPFGVIEHHGDVRYAWPSAFTYESWDDVPESERRALEPLYDEEDLRSFERFGGYIGHRVVILDDGTWTVFVAGD